jgi:hypothetical protein
VSDNLQEKGIGSFFLALIPWALAIGLGAWFGLYVSFHDFDHQESQEKRAAVYVGAQTPPKSKVKIEIVPHDCTHITRADIDGTQLMLYAQSTCQGRKLDYLEWHWQMIAPDSTAIQAGYENMCAVPIHYGDKAECQVEVKDDERADKIRIWTNARIY